MNPRKASIGRASIGAIGAIVLRSLAVGVAALCLAWAMAPASGIAAACAGGVLGVLFGQWLGKSRVRLPVAWGGAFAIAVLAFAIASWISGSKGAADALGTGVTLRLVTILRFGAASACAFGALRTLAARRASALVLELGVIAGALAFVFAAHREGIISRPLWLSDWAWQRGIDPASVFLVLGGAAVTVLGLLLVAEAEGRRGSATLVLALLAMLGVVVVMLIGPPKPEPDADLGLTKPDPSSSASASAAPSPPRPPSSASPDGGADGGSTPPPRSPDAGDPDGGGQPNDAPPDGGANPDGGDGGSPPPPPSSLDGGSQPTSSGDASTQDGSAGDGGPPPPASEQLEQPSAKDESDNGPSPMAIVLLDDDYSPPSQVYYFRQEAWSQWNGTRLVAAARSDVDQDTFDHFPLTELEAAEVPPAAERGPVRGQVALLVEHTQPFTLEGPVRVKARSNPNPSRFVRAYRFEAWPLRSKMRDLVGHKAGNPAWSPEVRAHYLETTSDPRFAELAKRIRDRMPEASKNDPFLQAAAVKLHLDRGYKYSRAERHAGVPDPTADFLFGNRIGYCVHFAHAAVLLWRSLGLPSRVGTGYATEEQNRRGGSSILLLASNAHAWPEIYLEGVGWVVLDISPQESLDDATPPVDEDLQRLLGEMARELPPDPTQVTKGPPPEAWLRAAGLFLLFTAGALVVLLYLAKGWRRVAPLLAPAAELPRVAYRTSLDLMAEAGWSRRRGESREAFARRAETDVPSFAALTALHLEGRLGAGQEGSRAFARPAWSEALAKLRADLGQTSAWRRFAGLLNPLSFLWSK